MQGEWDARRTAISMLRFDGGAGFRLQGSSSESSGCKGLGCGAPAAELS